MRIIETGKISISRNRFGKLDLLFDLEDGTPCGIGGSDIETFEVLGAIKIKTTDRGFELDGADGLFVAVSGPRVIISGNREDLEEIAEISE